MDIYVPLQLPLLHSHFTYSSSYSTHYRLLFLKIPLISQFRTRINYVRRALSSPLSLFFFTIVMISLNGIESAGSISFVYIEVFLNVA